MSRVSRFHRFRVCLWFHGFIGFVVLMVSWFPIFRDVNGFMVSYISWRQWFHSFMCFVVSMVSWFHRFLGVKGFI